MAEKSIKGFEKVEMGACGANGAMGTSLSEIGLTVPDSVVFNIGETEESNIYVEQSDTPYITDDDGKRVSVIEFETRDVDPDTLAILFGGSVSTDIWSAPTAFPSIFQSVKLTSKSDGAFYYTVSLPRAKIQASLTGEFKKDDTARVKVRALVQTPLDAVGDPLSPIQIAKVAV